MSRRFADSAVSLKGYFDVILDFCGEPKVLAEVLQHLLRSGVVLEMTSLPDTCILPFDMGNSCTTA